MKLAIGTKSVLFGVHQFALHPLLIALGWWKAYGFRRVQIGVRDGAVRPFPFDYDREQISVTVALYDPRLWIAFIVHDLGYIGKPKQPLTWSPGKITSTIPRTSALTAFLGSSRINNHVSTDVGMSGWASRPLPSRWSAKERQPKLPACFNAYAVPNLGRTHLLACSDGMGSSSQSQIGLAQLAAGQIRESSAKSRSRHPRPRFVRNHASARGGGDSGSGLLRKVRASFTTIGRIGEVYAFRAHSRNPRALALPIFCFLQQKDYREQAESQQFPHPGCLVGTLPSTAPANMRGTAVLESPLSNAYIPDGISSGVGQCIDKVHQPNVTDIVDFCDMDGPEGETHPEFGARVMRRLFGEPWGDFVLLHSRYYAKRLGRDVSPLCVADKWVIVLEPSWLYLPRVWASGELAEFMEVARKRGAGGARASDPLTDAEKEAFRSGSALQWHRTVKAYMRRWITAHEKGGADTWTRVRHAETA